MIMVYSLSKKERPKLQKKKRIGPAVVKEKTIDLGPKPAPKKKKLRPKQKGNTVYDPEKHVKIIDRHGNPRLMSRKIMEGKGDHLIKKGQVLNPKGRGKGNRSKINEKFLKTLHDDFEKYGKKAVENCRETDPVAYVRMVASLVPKQMQVHKTETSAIDAILDNINDDQLEEFVNGVRALTAIEVSGEEITEERPSGRSD